VLSGCKGVAKDWLVSIFFEESMIIDQPLVGLLGLQSVFAIGEQCMTKIYEFTAKALDGKPVNLEAYKGQVMLVVNTASKCGFTPQFTGLQALHQKFGPKGLAVLGFPCNQFGHQEPGDATEIGAFCQKNYGVDFQMFEKIEVNGDGADPIFKYLTETAPGALGTKAVKWNFTKFLIDKEGKVLKRYAPNVTPEALEGDIEKLVSA